MPPERQRLLFPEQETRAPSNLHDASLAGRICGSAAHFRAAIAALAPWFGSNRLLATQAARLLDGCEWVGIPFAGGMSEVPHIKALTVVVNDLHEGIITLGRVTADSKLGPQLYRRLRRKLLHPLELRGAQDRCRLIESLVEETRERVDDAVLLTWAEHYFTAVWMARAGAVGTDRELDAGLALRWNAGGGDSATRYQNAVRSLNEWRRTLRRATFSTLDVFAFLDKCKDEPKHGIYCDQPFPGPGDAYRHTFDAGKTAKLAERLSMFEQARVVCRFYDHPLIRDLYPESLWHWRHLAGRKQTNAEAPEVLLLRN